MKRTRFAIYSHVNGECKAILLQKWSRREVPRESDWVRRTACLPRSPEALGVNPSRTIGALAERAADLIAKEGR